MAAVSTSCASEIEEDQNTEAPSWLNIPLVEEALRRDPQWAKNKGKSVKKLAICRATAPGENYSSVLYRIQASLSDGETMCSLLAKVPPEGEALGQSSVGGGLFQREIDMLGEYIPAMEALLEKECPGRFPPFAARCLLHGSSPVPFLVLEDLKPLGFRLADRLRGLGLRHSLLAIRSLARFHAASAALLQANPSIVDKLFDVWSIGQSKWETWFVSCINAVIDACRKWPGFEEYAERLERFRPKMMETTRLFKPIPGKFNVILHGDFWVNNIMFTYGDQYPEDIRMIDLQLSTVSSPALDLLYFLFTSPSDEVSEQHESLLLREYHAKLVEICKLLGQAAPSFAELLSEMDRLGAFAVFFSFTAFPVVKTERAPDMEAAISGDLSEIAFVFENPAVQRWLKRIFPEFKRRGWMDF